MKKLNEYIQCLFEPTYVTFYYLSHSGNTHMVTEYQDRLTCMEWALCWHIMIKEITEMKEHVMKMMKDDMRESTQTER